MLGPLKARCLDRPAVVSLETLVPRNHFYRHLEATFDLSFVREWVVGYYAAGGRPSIDPVIFFKLQLIMFFEGIRSERKLIETASLHLAHRWYLGYHLDEPLPDHSSLTRIRQRLGVPVFRRFFEQVVDLCDQAGLVWGKELFFDATKVRANAALDSLVPRLHLVVDEHLEALFAQDGDEPTAPACQEVAGRSVADPEERVPGVVYPAFPTAAGTLPDGQAGRWDLLEQCRLDPERPRLGSYQRLSDLRVSTTDPDATPMRASGQRAALGYHDHYVVDGGKARIILYPLVTPADVMENEPMQDLLWRVIFRWQLRPERIVADTTYGTIENIRTLEDAGIRAYVPLADWDRTDYYGPSQFCYEAEQDAYRCPHGQLLRRHGVKHTLEVVMYQAEATTCNRCPLKAACTASDQGRQVRRSFYADYLDRVRAYHATAAYRKAMRKRKVWPEPLFGEAKQWHGLRQFRLRGLPNVNIEGLWIATGQNLKRWLTVTGWGRRHGPGGSLFAPPAAGMPASTPI
jgi:transposase